MINSDFAFSVLSASASAGPQEGGEVLADGHGRGGGEEVGVLHADAEPLLNLGKREIAKSHDSLISSSVRVGPWR